MRHITKHVHPLNLPTLGKPVLPPNPELVILRNKRKQYDDELLWGKTDLTFNEWLQTDKK